MSFLKSYSYSIKIIIVIVMLTVMGWFGYASTFCDNGIVDYQAFRDKLAIKKIFHDDWQLLYYGDFDKIKETDFNVDFMLDNRSSSQHAVHSNLVMKVLRESGKTVGFLAYYPKSPYWWHMLFLIVDKDHRGKGYASKLVQFFIDDSVAHGAIKLTTFTRLINTPARAVYEGKFGFKDIGHHEDKYMDLLLYPPRKKK
ncbi:MAG: GNAT family N-acetyltransferase [Candidatus Chromulinivorax sp.]|nr:GNAT family N-acetyltransferase [Candidatus Chromulinivorax sp.]